MENGNPGKIIAVVGPTASGKSDLGVEIARQIFSKKNLGGQARHIGAEIISADSRQVYRGMDIGTGKITKKEMRGVPHHLLDVVSPNTDFNVTKFKRLAETKIKEIFARGKTPVIVGGTGFWIDALIYDFDFPEVKPDRKLRARLEAETVAELFSELRKLDPVRAKGIDAKNKRRLVRALEIVLSNGKPIVPLNKKEKYPVVFIGIKKSKEELEERIRKRLIARLEQGMIGEVKKLRKIGVSWKRLDDFGLEYRYVSRFLRGQLHYDQMVEGLFAAIKKYAKRQMTWFKRNGKIKWVSSPAEAVSYLNKVL